MSTTKGQHRGILATLMSVLALLLVGVLLTAGASRAAAQTTAGTATAGTAAAAGNTRQVLYMFPEGGYVELLVLEITGSSLTGSALTDVYNCGNNQVNGSSAIVVSGTVNSSGDVDLQFYGISGTFPGIMGPEYLDLTGPSGDTVQFQETSTTGLGDAVVQNEPPVYSISGYTCSDLSATYWP